MTERNEERRRPVDNPNPERGARPVDQALSSKRSKPKDRLEKNKGQKTPGNPRSGSDSNAGRRTRGH